MFKHTSRLLTLLFIAACIESAAGDDFVARCADRTAIERIYHAHRLGNKMPFEEAMPQAAIEKIARTEQRREEVLKEVYGVEITPGMVAAEVERINTTTRAPDVLNEIKQALGNDAARFAVSMARPILVERELRRRFENDGKLHAAQRREAEQARAMLLAGQPVAGLHEETWHLTPRPVNGKAGVGSDGVTPLVPQGPAQTKASSRNYTNEASAQVAQSLQPPDHPAPLNDKNYFDDLNPELRRALSGQLNKPGDVSSVIETSGAYHIFVVREKSAETLRAAAWSISKRSLEDWLTTQPVPPASFQPSLPSQKIENQTTQQQ